MRKRIAFACTALAMLAGCGPPLPPALMPDNPPSKPKRDLLVDAVRCGQAYAAARITSVATGTEISEAAVSACSAEISNAADAVAADFIEQLVTQHLPVDDRDVSRQRARALDQMSAKVRGEALRVVVDGRQITPNRPKAAGAPSI